MLPDSQPSLVASPVAPRDRRLLAPLWHTAVVLFILIGASLGGSRGVHPLVRHNKISQYLWTMYWEWALTVFVYLGIR